MNENLESILNALTGAAQNAATRAKSLGSIAKSNFSILTEQEKLKKAYAELEAKLGKTALITRLSVAEEKLPEGK